MAFFHEHITSTEGPPRIGEVSTNFLWIDGAAWHAYGSLRPYSRIYG
jgi:hypothetical protein